MLAAARRRGVRILGPNCLGAMRTDTGLNATFARKPARKGNLAVVSQSGAICGALLDWADRAGVGFTSVVSLGAAADVDFGEILDFLMADGSTEAVLLYVEGIRDARRYLSALRAAARVKPVIALKVSVTRRGESGSSQPEHRRRRGVRRGPAARRHRTRQDLRPAFRRGARRGEHAPAAGRAPRHPHERRRSGRGRRRQRGRKRGASRYAFCARPFPCWMRSCRRSGRTAIRSTSSATRRPSASPRPRRRCSPTPGSMRCSRCTRRSRSRRPRPPRAPWHRPSEARRSRCSPPGSGTSTRPNGATRSNPGESPTSRPRRARSRRFRSCARIAATRRS